MKRKLTGAHSFYIWAASKTKQNDLCTQPRLRSALASAQSDQSRPCPHEETLGSQLPMERTAKTLIRLGDCPGWSECSLGHISFCWFCHAVAHLRGWFQSRSNFLMFLFRYHLTVGNLIVSVPAYYPFTFTFKRNSYDIQFSVTYFGYTATDILSTIVCRCRRHAFWNFIYTIQFVLVSYWLPECATDCLQSLRKRRCITQYWNYIISFARQFVAHCLEAVQFSVYCINN